MKKKPPFTEDSVTEVFRGMYPRARTIRVRGRKHYYLVMVVLERTPFTLSFHIKAYPDYTRLQTRTIIRRRWPGPEEPEDPQQVRQAIHWVLRKVAESHGVLIRSFRL